MAARARKQELEMWRAARNKREKPPTHEIHGGRHAALPLSLGTIQLVPHDKYLAPFHLMS